jgi:hypothetical protein
MVISSIFPPQSVKLYAPVPFKYIAQVYARHDKSEQARASDDRSTALEPWNGMQPTTSANPPVHHSRL